MSHSCKEANKYANVLVSIGCTLGPDIVFYNATPDCIVSLLNENSCGV